MIKQKEQQLRQRLRWYLPALLVFAIASGIIATVASAGRLTDMPQPQAQSTLGYISNQTYGNHFMVAWVHA